MTVIRYDRDADGVVTLTWDAPGRSMNVVDGDFLDDLERALDRLAGDTAATGVILTSGKDAFAAGGDLRRIEGLARGELDREGLFRAIALVNRRLRRLETCGKPVVAALGGTAVGGGYEIALCCHRRIAADDPRLQLGLPEAQLGLMPGAGGTQRLARLIGIARAAPFLLEGKTIGPREALAAGMIDEVVPRAELLAAARRWLATQPQAVQPWDRKGFEIPGGGPESRAVLQFFTGANAGVRGKTHGNYPAPSMILECLYEGCGLPLERSLAVETRCFVALLAGPEARCMVRTLFIGVEAANKLARRPPGVARREPGRIGVLGAGLMGSGIAAASARAGLEVVLLDRDAATAEAGKVRIRQDLDRAVEKGRTTAEQRDRLLGRIHATASFSDLAGAALIVEAVFEDRAVKAEVTRRAEEAVAADAVLASNTSTLPVTGLAEACRRPERFLGLHFFSPVEKMPLVEVIRGRQTSDEALAWALDYVQRIKKTPILVRDSRGFYTSRVFGTYLTEGCAMLTEGIAPALIENAGRMSGMPMPPLALADEVGLGLMHAVRDQTRRDLGAALPDNPSSAVLDVVVGRLGRTGKRGGAGFYDYATEGERRLWPGLREHFAWAPEQPPARALVERFLYTQALEAARCMEEGILVAAQDADVGAVLGWGFAPYTGGPLSFIDTVGAARFVKTAEHLAARHGARFAPPQLLRDMAASGRAFY